MQHTLKFRFFFLFFYIQSHHDFLPSFWFCHFLSFCCHYNSRSFFTFLPSFHYYYIFICRFIFPISLRFFPQFRIPPIYLASNFVLTFPSTLFHIYFILVIFITYVFHPRDFVFNFFFRYKFSLFLHFLHFLRIHLFHSVLTPN